MCQPPSPDASALRVFLEHRFGLVALCGARNSKLRSSTWVMRMMPVRAPHDPARDEAPSHEGRERRSRSAAAPITLVGTLGSQVSEALGQGAERSCWRDAPVGGAPRQTESDPGGQSWSGWWAGGSPGKGP